MATLVKKAAKEAWKHNQNAYGTLASMSDNLHDIQLYLDINKEALPSKGEVEIKELFEMMVTCISDYEKAETQMKETNEWVQAIING